MRKLVWTSGRTDKAWPRPLSLTATPLICGFGLIKLKFYLQISFRQILFVFFSPFTWLSIFVTVTEFSCWVWLHVNTSCLIDHRLSPGRFCFFYLQRFFYSIDLCVHRFTISELEFWQFFFLTLFDWIQFFFEFRILFF